MKDKTPHSIDAEKALLGSIILENNTIPNIAPHIVPSDFYSNQHQHIFKAILKIYKANKDIDLVTLSTALDKQEILDAIGGTAYLTTLSNHVPSASNYKSYMDIVQKKSRARKIIALSNEAIEQASKGKIDTALSLIQTKTRDVVANNNEFIDSIGNISQRVLDRYTDIKKNGYSPGGIPIGYPKLSRVVESWLPGEYIVISARPSVGKTALALNFMIQASIQQNYKSLFFSLEMPKERLAERIMANIGDYPNTLARLGKLDDKSFKKIEKAKKLLENDNIFIDDKAGCNIEYIRSRCHELKLKGQLDIVFIDYLGLIRGDSKKNRNNEIAEISRELKALAKDFNVPVIALAQLNRNVESRENRRPSLSDLRDSGEIEQDIDISIMLQRHGDREIEVDEEDYTIIINKNRNGPTHDIKFTFMPKRLRFVENGSTFKVEKEIKQPKLEEFFTDEEDEDMPF